MLLCRLQYLLQKLSQKIRGMYATPFHAKIHVKRIENEMERTLWSDLLLHQNSVHTIWMTRWVDRMGKTFTDLFRCNTNVGCGSRKSNTKRKRHCSCSIVLLRWDHHTIAEWIRRYIINSPTLVQMFKIYCSMNCIMLCGPIRWRYCLVTAHNFIEMKGGKKTFFSLQQ